MLKIIIWGWGTNGKNLFDILGEENVLAIIESNKIKLGLGSYHNIPIIDFRTYLSDYKDYYIVVSAMKYQTIEDELKANNVDRYFIQSQCAVRNMAFAELKYGRLIKKIGLDKKRKYFISGVNLFSLYLYCYLLNQGYQINFLAVNQDQTTDLDQVVGDHIISQYCCEISSEESCCLIQTDEYCYTNRENLDIIDYRVINDAIYEKWKNDLTKFKNCQSGKRVFIVATGPSLQAKDLETLYEHHEITISMNRIYYIFDQTTWRPDYYVVSDGEMMRDYEKLPEAEQWFNNAEKFFSDNYLKFWETHRGDSYHCFLQKQNFPDIKFSYDFSKVVYSGLSVIYACLQLAVYLGVQSIYLLGCDFNSSLGPSSTQNHFYGDVKNSSNAVYIFDHEGVKLAYEKAKEYAGYRGVKIYNATRGGELEIFQRVKFEELFENGK